jgi:FKBP-type peptidyl-prolyl cis-trans isomerase FkpA
MIKYTLVLSLLQLIYLHGNSQDIKADYILPDSIRAIAFYADVSIKNAAAKNTYAGIQANGFRLELAEKQKNRIVRLNFDKNAKSKLPATGVTEKRGIYSWKYNWKEDQIYSLLFVAAADSATNQSIYSGYILLPEENKWKLISTQVFSDTFKITQAWPAMSGELNNAVYSNRWLMRSNGSWKALDSQTNKPPVIRPLMRNVDSVDQERIEIDQLRSMLPKDSAVFTEGIFYQVTKAGNGRMVVETDTLVVHYKGSLFSDGTIFDQTKEKPATFPLGRLIKGWQVGLVHCRVGGKIRLFIPSGNAYGIRTITPKIPPNSILVFDIEVLDAKEKK